MESPQVELYLNISSSAEMPDSMNHYNRMVAAVVKENGWNYSSNNILPLMVILNTKPYQKIIFGYALPAVIAITTILNLFVFSILTKPSMKASINVILAAIAVSDSLTGLTALPYYIYFYSRDIDQVYIPYQWCYIQKLTSGIFPTIFHTISVWLTVTLAVQRYIYLCHSLRAKRLCTVRRMKHAVAIISVSAFAFHSPRLFDSRFIKVTLDVEDRPGYVDTCAEIQQPWAENYQHLYYPIYYWSRVILINLLPSVGLVILNMVLVYVMRSTNRKRRLLILQNRNNEWRRIQETNITTFMLTVVVSAFLLVETPLGVLTLLATVKSQYGLNILTDDEITEMISVAFNLVLLLSYPLNFFLYVSMSKKFRMELCRIFSNKNKVNDSVGTIQTSREKSSSMELIKTIFTVIAVPTGRTGMVAGRKASGISAGSSNSATSCSVQPQQISSSKAIEYEKTNATCRCPCKHCIERCQKPRGLVNVSTYAGQLES